MGFGWVLGGFGWVSVGFAWVLRGFEWAWDGFWVGFGWVWVFGLEVCLVFLAWRAAGRVWLRGASCRGVVGRCNKQMGWAGLEVRLAGVWLGGAISKWDGQMFKILLRLAGVWLGGAISRAHLGGRGKQVQAILSLLGPILGGRGKQVQAILSLLGPIGAHKSKK